MPDKVWACVERETESIAVAIAMLSGFCTTFTIINLLNEDEN
jgi:uncharacterized membrane protein